jgi:hypothetical protein
MPFREGLPPRRRDAVKAEEAGGESFKAEEEGGEGFEAEEEGGLGAVKAEEEGGEGFETVGIDGGEVEGGLEGGDGCEAVDLDDSEFFTEDVVGGCLADGCGFEAVGLEGGEEGCEGSDDRFGAVCSEECGEEDMGDEELKIALRDSAASVLLDELARHIGDSV